MRKTNNFAMILILLLVSSILYGQGYDRGGASAHNDILHSNGSGRSGWGGFIFSTIVCIIVLIFSVGHKIGKDKENKN